MQLKTARLLIRELSVKDIDVIHQLHSLPETDEFNTLGIPDSIETTERIVQIWLDSQMQKTRNSFVFAIETIDNKQFIGLIAINLGKPTYKTAEIWYKLHKDFWGKSYATEALTRTLAFGFNELKLHRIEAGCAVENIGSIKVLEKAGMIREGMKRKKLPIQGTWKDNYFYAILEEDFIKIP